MKNLFCLFALLLILASCERSGTEFSDQPLKQSRNEVKKSNDPAITVANSFNPDEPVDPKDIVPPRR